MAGISVPMSRTATWLLGNSWPLGGAEVNVAQVIATMAINAIAAEISISVIRLALRDVTTNLRHQRGVRRVCGAACVAIVAVLHRYCCKFARIKTTKCASKSLDEPLGPDIQFTKLLAQGVSIDPQ